jgi:Ecdysteroid kinase-like family
MFKHSAYESQLIMDMFFRKTLQLFYEVVETWKGFEHFLPKLKIQIENVAEIGIKSYTANTKGCGFNVLNHGDFQMRNILLKADADSQIKNICLVIQFESFDVHRLYNSIVD